MKTEEKIFDDYLTLYQMKDFYYIYSIEDIKKIKNTFAYQAYYANIKCQELKKEIIESLPKFLRKFFK